MGDRIVTLTAADAWARRMTLGEVYREAFGCTTAHALGFVQESLVHVLSRDGAVVRIQADGNDILGFLYGYTFQRGNWWPEMVGPAIEAAGYGHMMIDAFELVELAVRPHVQGRGIGSSLLRHQLNQQPETYTLLSTNADAGNRAITLYVRHGFKILVPDFQYNSNGDKAIIMGRDPTG